MSYVTHEETGQAVYQDWGGVTTDEKRGSAVGAASCQRGRYAYVLVNNRSEENAPLTVQALAEMLAKGYRLAI